MGVVDKHPSFVAFLIGAEVGKTPRVRRDSTPLRLMHRAAASHTSLCLLRYILLCTDRSSLRQSRSIRGLLAPASRIHRTGNLLCHAQKWKSLFGFAIQCRRTTCGKCDRRSFCTNGKALCHTCRLCIKVPAVAGHLAAVVNVLEANGM